MHHSAFCIKLWGQQTSHPNCVIYKVNIGDFVMDFDAHRRRVAGPPNGIRIKSSRRRATTLIIQDSEIEFLKQLKLQQNNEQQHGECIAEPVSVTLDKEKSRKSCAVCFHESDINAVTSCEHVYCYQCALRLVCHL